MKLWSAEIKELGKLYVTFKGQHPKLDKELDKLINTEDENMVLVYARRCLEVIITLLCEAELKRSRGTEPMKGIIDKLNREEKVPHHIIVPMQNLNSLSTFGAHPKDIHPRQVKPVFNYLTSIIEWYLQYLESKPAGISGQGTVGPFDTAAKITTRVGAMSGRRRRSLIRTAVGLGILITLVAMLAIAGVFNGIKKIKAAQQEKILVLPFNNNTGIDTMEWWFHGMHSSIITDMQQFKGFTTISETTARAVKERNMTINEIADFLRVSYVMEPVVTYIGDGYNFNFTLIACSGNEEPVWDENIPINKSQITGLGYQLAGNIAREINLELTLSEQTLLNSSKDINPDAFDAFMKGKFYWEQFTEESLQMAMEYFNLAASLDPDWGEPYAGLAYYWIGIRQRGFAPDEVTLPEIEENLQRALELDPDNGFTCFVGALASWMRYEWNKAERAFIKALEINSDDALVRMFYAQYLTIFRRNEEAAQQGQIAVNMDPLNPLIHGLYSMLNFWIGNWSGLRWHGEKAMELHPDLQHTFWDNQYSLYHEGKFRDYLSSQSFYRPDDLDVTPSEIVELYDNKGWDTAFVHLMAAWEQSRDPYAPIQLAEWHTLAGNDSIAMDYYELAYEKGSPNLPFISCTAYITGEYRVDDPRFDSLLAKMNLPPR